MYFVIVVDTLKIETCDLPFNILNNEVQQF